MSIPVTRPVSSSRIAPLRQVEFERLARVAPALEHGVGVPQRLQHGLEQRPGLVVGRAVEWPPGPADRRAWPPSASSRDGSCASVCGRWRRSPCARPVRRGPRLRAASTDRWRCAPAASARRGRGNRPNCRACAPRGRAPSRAGHRRLTSAMATVTMTPPGLLSSSIRLGVDRVVMVLGVGRIDGDERQVAPVLAPFQVGPLGRIGLVQHIGRKDMRGCRARGWRSSRPPFRSIRSDDVEHLRARAGR